jgi:hypothetical protein
LIALKSKAKKKNQGEKAKFLNVKQALKEKRASRFEWIAKTDPRKDWLGSGRLQFE